MFTTSFAFIFFHWPTWWTSIQLCFPSWPRAAGAVPYPYPWPLWRHAQHSWSLPNFQPFTYSVKLSSPLGSSDHNLISITYSITPVQPQDLPKQRCFWHFNSAKWEDQRQYYSDFPWDDYCLHDRDPTLCAECIIEVIIFGMELYILHTFSNTKAKKPWFNSAWSRTVKNREVAHKQYHSHPSAETQEWMEIYLNNLWFADDIV